jgi:hypothetical protein
LEVAGNCISGNAENTTTTMKKIDINAVYGQLIKKLKESDYSDEIRGIENSSEGAATGSEALMNQGFHLMNLRNSNFQAFKLVEKEINEYLQYCKERGLLIRRQ